jgi:sialate O-acetylesterase
VLNEDQEIAAATDNQIRFYQGGGGNNKPQPGSKSGWEVCSPENAPRFSAVGYFFAKKLRSELKSPVGTIVLAAGGRPAEWFTPERMMTGDVDFQAQKIQAQAVRDELGAKGAADKKAGADYKKELDKARSKGEKAPQKPTNQLTAEETSRLSESSIILDFGFIYERDIHPVAPFPIKGFLWYQGESNATRGDKYAALMSRLIQGWREDWGRQLPFVIVALAGYGKPEPWTPRQGSYPLVREAMIKVTETVPNVGVISAIDAGEADNIHPLDKKPVGERAALWALNHVYGRKVVSDGPKFGKTVFSEDKAEVSFLENADGLTLKSPGGFELAGVDQKFFPAKAEFKGNALEITAPGVKNPVALRYAFLNFPECTVYNGAGLPALPFRTDDWPVKSTTP